ncbi:hypothetical protein GALMADRAFT_215039 [Galerina marginata CBS 339.88]|uniref:Oxidase ustYa n=1 Tax=Galerina marginata (strain CBS 339.88) TaxID=685588 RepID=A0A067SFE6_GALM3|nr:hypothetical protein GALMADRAFT_215039 [Galerina marginata CBS 339.88]
MPLAMPSKLFTLWTMLFVLNILVTVTILFSSGYQRHKEHTYVGDDYPLELPLTRRLDLVAMTLQETGLFEVNMSDPVAEDEAWTSFIMQPRGIGRIFLGPSHRLFNIAFLHQLHCLREMERGFRNPSSSILTPLHAHHCLNYLRQAFLCEADHTLEEGDFLQRNFDVQRSADTRVCRDWETVYQVLDREWLKE